MSDIFGDKKDIKTAQAFALSWNNLPEGSIYTKDQFEDWLAPLTEADIKDKSILELGCGNASMMVHIAGWRPSYLEGIDLGDSILSAESNLKKINFLNWKIVRGDLTEYTSAGFDVVYCIGVIHHLKDPQRGFESLVRNTKKGGQFHAWVYAREGNGVIIYIVDPLRKAVSRLPWWFIKYLIATPFVAPYYIYAKIVSLLKGNFLIRKLPLYEYSLWISKRNFHFFRHVAFDQLVTPQTAYIKKDVIKKWFESFPEIDKENTYIIMRNGNSWKFGGKIK